MSEYEVCVCVCVCVCVKVVVVVLMCYGVRTVVGEKRKRMGI